MGADLGRDVLEAILLKLIVTPTLIGAASLAGRRWGPDVSGWLVGLPFTSGPVVLFLALSHGASFAASAAAGTMAGTVSQVAYCLAYARLAGRQSWLGPFVSGCITFAACTVVLRLISLPVPIMFAVVVAALLAGLKLMPASEPSSGGRIEPPVWDIPARMALATAVVMLLTGVAPALGPTLTGLLAPFPLYASILTIFAHRLDGPAAARRVLGGLLFGLFAFASFFLALALILPRRGIAIAFAAAVLLALALQGCSLQLLRRQSPSIADQALETGS